MTTTKHPRQLEAEIAQIAQEIEQIESSPEGQSYQERVEARRDRLERASLSARTQARTAFDRAHGIGDRIPFGQPILVGHHSERRHRRDLERIDASMRRAVEASEAAEDLQRRAQAVGSGGISSDDPAAVQKLRLELAGLEQLQEQMKVANAAIRKHAKRGQDAQVDALIELGFPKARALALLKPDFAGRIGFADYALKNNSANITRIKKRIAELSARATAPERPPVSGSIDGIEFTIAENKAANRTQIHFAGKPAEPTREALKSAGFRWAPSEGVWQRQMSSQAWYRAHRALGIPLA